MLIHNSMYESIYKDISYHVKYDLDFDKMVKESKYMEHDFKVYEFGIVCKDTVRNIWYRLTKQEDLIVLEVEGNGFLYNMVRIIVGTLVDIVRRINKSLKEILESKSRSECGHTAPAHGLFLKSWLLAWYTRGINKLECVNKSTCPGLDINGKIFIWKS